MNNQSNDCALSELVFSLRKFGQNPAICIDGGEISFEQLDQLSDRYAGRLVNLGALPGDVVMFYSSPSIDSYAACIGALKSGLTVSTTHHSFSQNKLRLQMQISGATFCICDENTALEGTLSNHTAINFISVPLRYQQTQTCEEDKFLPPRRLITPGEVVAIFFTSGSSGTPKGAQITAQSMFAAYQTVSQHFDIGTSDNILSASSLGSDFGFYNVVVPMLAGACSTILTETTDDSVTQALATESVTAIHGMPPLIQAVASAVRRLGPLLQLRYVCSTGQSLSPTYFEKIGKKNPQTDLFMMYGMTECKRILCSKPYIIGSFSSDVGTPVGDCIVHLMSASGDIIERLNFEGELIVHSQMVMDQYVNGHDSNKDKFVWVAGKRFLRTGDYFCRNANGNFKFKNRKDSVYTRQGFKFDCADIEASISRLSEIKTTAVVAQRDGSDSAVPIAFVVLNEPLDVNSISCTIVEHVATELDWQCVPSLVLTVETLPTMASGKTDIGLLSGMYSSEILHHLTTISE